MKMLSLLHAKQEHAKNEKYIHHDKMVAHNSR